MDKIDRELVRLLEDDARMSFAELGQQVGLSKTPCWQRVRELERRGLIRGYRTELDAEGLGLHVHAFVHVTINAARHAEFEAAAAGHPSVLLTSACTEAKSSSSPAWRSRIDASAGNIARSWTRTSINARRARRRPRGSGGSVRELTATIEPDGISSSSRSSP